MEGNVKELMKKMRSSKKKGGRPFETYSDALGSIDIPSDMRVILIDERGDFGIKKGSSKTYVIAASETKDPKEFVNIAMRYPKNTKGTDDEDSLKFNTSQDWIRRSVVRDITLTDSNVYAITGHKTDKKSDAVKTHEKMLRKLSNQLMKSTNAKEFIVIMDNNTTIRKGEGCKIVSETAKSNEKKIIECQQLRAKDEPILQTHDFVVGGIGHYEENDDKTYVRQLQNIIKSWMSEKV
jgi:hypothetical protein